MYIAKTNDIRNNSAVVNSGTISSGSADNVLNPNFSRVLVLTGAMLEVELGSVSDASYVAVHGLETNLKGNTTLMGCSIGATNKTWTWTDGQYTTYFVFDTPVTGTVKISFINSVNPSSKISIAYVACGKHSLVPNQGVRGGQVFAYLQNNFVTQNTLNRTASPTGSITKRVAPTVNLNFPQVENTWVSSELREIFTLSNELGVVSVYDEVPDFGTDSENRDWSWGAFGLSEDSNKANTQLRTLNDLNLKFKAAV